jgi:hypothetical protein
MEDLDKEIHFGGLLDPSLYFVILSGAMKLWLLVIISALLVIFLFF